MKKAISFVLTFILMFVLVYYFNLFGFKDWYRGHWEAPLPEVNINEEKVQGNLEDIKVTAREKIKDTLDNSIEMMEEGLAAINDSDNNSDLPPTFDQEMAFARQAPFGRWEEPFFQEGCEEASLIMVDHFYKGSPLDEQIMLDELEKIKPWVEEHFNGRLDTDTEETARMAREYFGLDASVSSDVTIERIKTELVAGNLVILPLTGREINNPNFTGEGPLYHMLVVRGYDRDQFITNDPGTRKGEG